MRWKQTSPLAVPEAGHGSVRIEGIPWLREKNELPFLWRFIWPWYVFLVDQRAESSYFAYFRTGAFAMHTVDAVHTPYVAVRIGPRDTDFAFTDVPNGTVLNASLKTLEPFKKSTLKKEFSEDNITYI